MRSCAFRSPLLPHRHRDCCTHLPPLDHRRRRLLRRPLPPSSLVTAPEAIDTCVDDRSEPSADASCPPGLRTDDAQSCIEADTHPSSSIHRPELTFPSNWHPPPSFKSTQLKDLSSVEIRPTIRSPLTPIDILDFSSRCSCNVSSPPSSSPPRQRLSSSRRAMATSRPADSPAPSSRRPSSSAMAAPAPPLPPGPASASRSGPPRTAR